MVAAIVYASDSVPLEWWILSALWLGVLALLAFLMVSTWRYPSFKEIHFKGPRSPLTVILFGALIVLIYFYSQPVLLVLATIYVGTGIVIRAAGIIRRMVRPQPPAPQPEPHTSSGALN